jgi:ABC-type transport system involved in multi-copper enzyme maturation permease subunit
MQWNIVSIIARIEVQEQRRALIFIPLIVVGVVLFTGVNQARASLGPNLPGAADSMAELTVTTSATLLSLAALLLPVGSMLRDRSRRTSSLIWSRPVSMPAYVLGRFLGSQAPTALGALGTLIAGLGLVWATSVSGASSVVAAVVHYLILYSAQVFVAIFYPAACTFCLASLSGSEELAYVIGVAYWLAARLPLGNAWMINFVTVTLGGPSPGELPFSLLGLPMLLNRVFYAVLAGALLFTTMVFYNREDVPRGWRVSLSCPVGGRRSWVVLGVCGVILAWIVILTQRVRVDLPPAWQIFM